MQPVETLTPLLKEPYLPGVKALHQELLPKIRSLCMAAYFTFDHLVWLGSVNIVKDKLLLERCVWCPVPLAIRSDLECKLHRCVHLQMRCDAMGANLMQFQVSEGVLVGLAVGFCIYDHIGVLQPFRWHYGCQTRTRRG